MRAVLEDGGDSLYAAANSGAEDWADRFGGPLAVALLAAEGARSPPTRSCTRSTCRERAGPSASPG